MVQNDTWPKELMIHYWRLDENFRSFITTYTEKNVSMGNDSLVNYIQGINLLMDTKGILNNNSEFLFLAANVLYIQAKYDKVYEICKKDESHPGLLNIKANSLVSQRKFDTLEEIINKAEKLSKVADHYNYLYSKANNLLYLYYSEKYDKIEEAYANFSAIYLELLEKHKNEDNMLLAFSELQALGKSVLILLNRKRGNMEEGIRIGKELLANLRLTKNRYLLNRILNNTSLCLIESGKLKEGLDYLVEAFSFSQVLANELQLSIAANNIGFIYRNMGILENAMKYFYIALENAKKAKIAPYIVATETNIAHLHLDFGNPKLALSNSETALLSLKKSEVPIPPTLVIGLDLCRADIYENMDQFDEADKILDEAIKLIEENELKNELPKVYIRKARLTARQSNLGESKKYLEKALTIAIENQLFEIIANAKLQLAEIDLLKYRMTNQDELLLDAYEKIKDLERLCLEQDFKLILIEVYILQGLLLSMSNNLKEGKKVLEKAASLAHELNLTEKEQEALTQLKEVEKEKKSLLVRIFTRINKSIRSTISFESVSKPKSVKAEVKALYVISKHTGLPFYQNDFGEHKHIDSALLSGLLSAIRTMGQTVLAAEEGGLKLIDHGNVSIMLETGSDCFFALVVTKETFLTREKLREFIEYLESENFFKGINHNLVLTDEKRNEAFTKLVEEYLL
ncbi:MAG: hypothetical protein JXA54_02150 [Candidatus Heimdallarchaeota archaeon]|nr:hypothetical protein [Candidatus Heimdallarchaeota archaeon]